MLEWNTLFKSLLLLKMRSVQMYFADNIEFWWNFPFLKKINLLEICFHPMFVCWKHICFHSFLFWWIDAWFANKKYDAKSILCIDILSALKENYILCICIHVYMFTCIQCIHVYMYTIHVFHEWNNNSIYTGATSISDGIFLVDRSLVCQPVIWC